MRLDMNLCMICIVETRHEIMYNIRVYNVVIYIYLKLNMKLCTICKKKYIQWNACIYIYKHYCYYYQSLVLFLLLLLFSFLWLFNIIFWPLSPWQCGFIGIWRTLNFSMFSGRLREGDCSYMGQMTRWKDVRGGLMVYLLQMRGVTYFFSAI